MMKLNKLGYQQLIDEDIIWLEKIPRTLERDHIIAVLKCSVEHEYPSHLERDPYPSPIEMITKVSDSLPNDKNDEQIVDEMIAKRINAMQTKPLITVRKPNEKADWDAYLTKMVAKYGDVGRNLNSMWLYAKTLNAPIPVATPSDDKDRFHLSWDREEHHLDVDVYGIGADGLQQWEWFYRNRKTDELDGDEKSGTDGFEARMKLITGG
jgi:hypothetical protein